MSESNHNWLDFDRYFSIHDRWIERACSYFVDEPHLVAPDVITPRVIRIHGDLFCKGTLVIHVDNYLRCDNRNRVREVVLRYQAQFAELPLRQIFRYDNDHIYAREGHPDAFHKHVFSNRTWREIRVEHIGREQFPTLLEVIDELYDWWILNRDDPLVYP